jgi:quinol-cytochrome oxidoreductase complex cytochrome b subunit
LFGHPDNYIQADPLVTPPHIVPERYFRPFHAILKSIPDKLGGAVAMGASMALLYTLPTLSRDQLRLQAFVTVYRYSVLVFILDVRLLG